MSVANVLKLAEHRDRRLHRLSLARTMVRPDRTRTALVDHLSEVADLTGSDRVAVVWIDEYGPGLVHPHVVLDLLSDRPRRYFSAEPLQKAWDFGIPGAHDETVDGGTDRSATFAVALGSDGARGWFVVADSVTRRLRLDEGRRERVMFLAGETSAIVLHRDLDAAGDEEGGAVFAGWRFLKDLEGHESDEARGEIVGRRFEVGRLTRGLVDEDLAMAEPRRAELAGRARDSLAAEPPEDEAERELLEALLDAYEAADLPALATAALALGESAERLDHVHGALELHRCAYDVASALSAPKLAVEAARAKGRIYRRRGAWEKADRWYGVALAIAEGAGLWELIARTRAGLAVIDRERGDMDAARDGLHHALEAAEAAKDADTTASIYQDLMVVEHMAGDLPIATRHGWRAVNTYASESGRTRCLVSFGTILKELGDWDAAEDAYTVVCRTSDELYYRMYASDALAHMAALRGDADAFDRRAAECDALGWEDGPSTAKAEIMLYRGISHALLGRRERARSWLERTIAFAGEHGFERVLGRAEEELAAVDDGREAREPLTPKTAPPEVREGLRAMRSEIAGAA